MVIEIEMQDWDSLVLTTDLSVRSGAVPWKWAVRALARPRRFLPGLSDQHETQVKNMLASLRSDGFCM